MRIRLAKTAGFCMGVRRAVEMVLDLQRNQPPLPIVTYGPLIHNPQTLELLASRGITQIDSLDCVSEGTVVVRAHGISPQEMEALRQMGVGIIDATCPRVSRVQAVIRKHARQGAFCVIVGDEDHPEVRGLIGYASSGGIAVPNEGCADLLASVPSDVPVCVVAQTTQEPRTFERVVEVLQSRCADLHVYNTICDSTRKRQAEVQRLAGQAEFVVVVGGKGSGNTTRLTKVAETQGIGALHVETAEEIEPAAFSGIRSVAVTAGASTPNWQIRLVVDRLREIGMSRAQGPIKWLRRVADVAIMTYVWTALAGGALTATSLVLEGQRITWLPLLVSMLFVFSMHLLNRTQERSGAVRFNNPEIAHFYAGHRTLLTVLGAVSSAGAVLLSFHLGPLSCILITAMVILGGLYTVPLVTRKLFPGMKRRSLKDIPGSKTPLVALGWAMVAAIVPAFGHWATVSAMGLIVAFVFAAGTIFWRAALSDLLDIQGDRIVGRETIPILLGVNKAERILLWLWLFLVVLPAGAAALGAIPKVGYWLSGCSLCLGAFFLVYKKRPLVDRLLYEGALDGLFIATGIVSASLAA